MFPSSPKAYAIQWVGGGVVAEMFPSSPKAYAIQWGGGVVADIFPSSTKAYAIRWGGGSSAIFFLFRDLKTSYYLDGALDSLAIASCCA